MEILWSVPAADDLERICAWIERDSPQATRKVAFTIYETVGRLRDFPLLERESSRLPGRRELLFPSLPYITVYRITAEAIEVSRVYHAAQNWP
ncbi:type II toxin-antitoxin system RelE/ParE family toxin [Telmatobacter bradus]|uniref:type II toxin-antitoxin system RelE/ParE family toxin n=1 Tax=Telmatobacter bradus TaxID=474953 RepID=UPI003B42904B